MEQTYKEIELLFEQLYILSEMGTAFLEGGSGAVCASGTALKLRMTSPRIKARRIVGINAEKVKNVIYQLARVNGIDIKRTDININWQDGLPIDELEQTDILSKACGGKAIISRRSAVRKYNELSQDATDEELEKILEDEAITIPEVMNYPPTVQDDE